MKLTPELTEAVAELYRVFAPYRVPKDTGACPCCHSPEDEARLLSKPLRELGTDELVPYVMSALTTWGDADMFRHFLPRVFEWTLQEGNEQVDAEIIFGKLQYAKWKTWPPEEQRAVRQFLLSLWNEALEIDCNKDSQFEAWLCSIAHAEDDLSPYLQRWSEAGSVAALRNIVQIVLYAGIPWSARKYPFWQDRGSQFNQLADWLRGPEVQRKLELGLKAWPDDAFAEHLAEAARVLRS